MSDLAMFVASEPSAGLPASVPATTMAGVWECDLATEHLVWSDGVYDLFGLPRATVLDRAMTTALYVPASRIAMECRRLAAIRDKTGFTADAEIRVGSATRWIRIVAHVQCVDGAAVRLFGSKHDVTFESALWTAQGRSVEVTSVDQPLAVPEATPVPGAAARSR